MPHLSWSYVVFFALAGGGVAFAFGIAVILLHYLVVIPMSVYCAAKKIKKQARVLEKATTQSSAPDTPANEEVQDSEISVSEPDPTLAQSPTVEVIADEDNESKKPVVEDETTYGIGSSVLVLICITILGAITGAGVAVVLQLIGY